MTSDQWFRRAKAALALLEWAEDWNLFRSSGMYEWLGLQGEAGRTTGRDLLNAYRKETDAR